MLAAAFRWDIDDIAFKEFQHSLLHTLSGNVPGNRRIVALAGDLVDLINEHYPPLCLGHVVISFLEEACQDAFHIFTHIAGLGEYRRVNYGERDSKHLGDSLGQKSLAGPGRTDEEDIGLLQFDSIIRAVHKIVIDTLVVVVDSNRQHLLGPVLTDHVLIQEGLDVGRFLRVIYPSGIRLGSILARNIFEIVMSQLYAVAADETVNALEQVRDFPFRPAAEHAMPALG